MVRVIIERHCRPEQAAQMESLLVELRTRAMQRSGYVSGETLRSIDYPSLWVVISTWLDAEHWRAWQSSPERHEIASRMEPLLTLPERVSVFSFMRRGTTASAHKIDEQ